VSDKTESETKLTIKTKEHGCEDVEMLDDIIDLMKLEARLLLLQSDRRVADDAYNQTSSAFSGEIKI